MQDVVNKIDASTRVSIPALMHPLFRTEHAIQRGVERNLIFRTWGGIGDQICAEPTIRYALKKFHDCDISLASEIPELFSHLKFRRVFDLREESPNYDKYFLFDTITPPDDSNLVWCFISHMLTNCVDFPSMCALRLQLPVEDREITLKPTPPEEALEELSGYLTRGVVVHPGKHWQSKTFPKRWWDAVLSNLKLQGIVPILIGADTDDNRGTVDVDATGCVDLRNKLSISQSVWMCQNASVVLTNDSAPLHMAASGNAWIGFIATCKHPDMISHWRKGEWNWREKNFGRGGMWDLVDFCPNKKDRLDAEFIDPNILESWLPDPGQYSIWAADMHWEFEFPFAYPKEVSKWT